MNLNKLTDLKNELDKYRPIDSITLQSLIDDFKLRYTYNSTALEGNTLSIYETKIVIEEGITIGGKTVREHLEVINHDIAVKKLINDVQNKTPLDLKLILDYHEIILKGINDDWAGRYRNQQVLISGAKHKPVNPQKVYDEMNDFINRFTQDNLLHPVEKAALIHAELVRIHPFVDGNGRTARLMMNLELMKCGYPIVIIEVEDKALYCSILDEGHTSGNYQKFIDFVAEKCEKSLNLYLDVVSANQQSNELDFEVTP
jgi:Fic family protein